MKLPITTDYLIAEIGGNHEGNIDWALNMIVMPLLLELMR